MMMGSHFIRGEHAETVESASVTAVTIDNGNNNLKSKIPGQIVCSYSCSVFVCLGSSVSSL